MLASPALARGAGDFRAIHLNNAHTTEKIKTVYWIEGDYVPEAMAEISFFMRDWREELMIDFDRRTIDILASAHRLLETSEPFELVSGYRSPKTNAMLRARSKGVAANSYHIKGMASDVTLKSRSVAQMYRAGIACKSGGVGRYTKSDFVHLDCGPVRTWGR